MQAALTRDTFFQRLTKLAARAFRIGLCLLLAAQLITASVILIRGELPVPQFLLEDLRKQLADSGYTVTWKDVHVNLTGQLLVQDLDIRVSEGEQNRLLTADGALVRFRLLPLFTGRFSPSSIIIDDASLYCPAIVSPSGQLATLLDNFNINLLRTREHWQVNAFHAQVLGVRILADGNIPRPWLKAFAHELAQQDSETTERPFLQRYGDAAHSILARQQEVENLQSPSIFLRFSAFAPAAIAVRDSEEARSSTVRTGTDKTAQNVASAFATNPIADADFQRLLSDDSDEHLLVTLSLAAQGYRNEALEVESGQGLLRAIFVFDDDIVPYVLGTPYAQLENLKWSTHIQAERMILQLPRPSPKSGSVQGILDTPVDALRFSGWNINASGYPLGQARLRVVSSDGSDLTTASDYFLHASIADGWNHIGAFAHIDRTNRSGSVDFLLDWNTDYLEQLPPAQVPAFFQPNSAARLNAPIHASGHMILGNEFKPAWGAAHLRISGFEYETLLVNYAYARAHWNGHMLIVDEAVVHSPEGYTANLAYRQNLHTNQFRLEAEGTINPLALNPIVGEEWWNQLWGDFDFNPRLWPSASFAMAGAHGMGTDGKQIFVQAVIEDASYRKIPIHQANAMVFMDGNRVDLYDFYVKTARGSANTHLQWLWDGNNQVYLAFAATGTLPIEEAMLFVGTDTAKATENIRAPQPPRVSVVGVLLDNAESVYLKLYADVPAALDTPWVNFDKVRSHMLMTPTTRVFPDIEGVFAGGQVTANAAIDLMDGNRTFFKTSINLKDGHINRLEDGLPMLKKTEEQMAEASPPTEQAGETLALPDPMGNPGSTPLPAAAEVTTAATTESAESGMASETQSILDKPGWLDFKGYIEGIAQDMRTIHGGGKLSLNDADLGEIHVLGPISKLLQFVGMPLATLAFDKAETHWDIKAGVIYFPNLTVSGNTGMLKANGNIDLETNNLNFIVYLHPFGEVSMPVLSQALELFSPLSNLLSVRITGSLSVPQVQTSVRPGGIFRGRETIDPHDMTVPPPQSEQPEQPRKLRRPPVGPR